jgi:polyisoprenoid-binding protein YceI
MTTTNDRNQIQEATDTKWEIDPRASRVEFTARMRLMFLMNVKVQGRFTDVSGTLTVDADEQINSQVNVTIGSASLDTKMAARDKHLYSADFFEVEHYPTLTFTSRHIETIDRATGHYQVIGALTIRDVTREVSLDTWNVSPQAAGERPRLAFTLTTMLDRRDFGLTWSRPQQKIADEVNLALSIEFVPVSSVV